MIHPDLTDQYQNLLTPTAAAVPGAARTTPLQRSI
jgi:hypothetical protein